MILVHHMDNSTDTVAVLESILTYSSSIVASHHIRFPETQKHNLASCFNRKQNPSHGALQIELDNDNDQSRMATHTKKHTSMTS